MADLSRASSFLPTINCSSCSRSIEISKIGDHVCGGPTPGEPTPPPDNYGNFDRMPYKQQPTMGPGFLKPGRAIPPRVDTSAANFSFLPQDQLTPVSASPSRSVSPITPRSPFGRPLGPPRSTTAPLQRGPPSPQILSSNLDCAFPPFPTSRNTQKRQPQQENGYGANTLYAEPDQMYAPASPRLGSGKGVLQRMNTIAPGPFDVRKPQNAPDNVPEATHRRNASGGTLAGTTTGPRAEALESNRPSTAQPGHTRSTTNRSNGSQSGIVPSRMPRQNGYGGFGPSASSQPEPQPIQADNRSQTFPLPSEAREPPMRRPSEPYAGAAPRNPRTNENGAWLADQQRLPSSSPPRQRMPSVGGPDLSRPLPPRGASLIRPRTATKPGDVPPIPEVNIAAEFGASNPYHTPTVSQSSSASGYSEHSKTSSRSSPPRPGTSQSRRKPSNVDNLMADLESSIAELRPRELPSEASPPRKRAPPPAVLDPVPKFGPLFPSPESPMDPSMPSGRLSPIPQKHPARSQTPLLEPRDNSPPRTQNPQPDLRDRSPARRPSRPTTAKGNCKGCSEPIKGKSVSSADGRLTGRYHKSCFVCKTCLEPFQTATFYVIDDAPYCERHYHKLNGSVCNTCDKGIEGQYLESEGKQKFHPGCLRCSDCKRNLRHDYFEMNGRVYCERDAFRRAQQGRHLGLPGAGTNRMERRTTRLMMM